MGEARREVTIVNKRGLHARASAKFVAAVAEMDGCEVHVAKDGHRVLGNSILDVMMLGAAKGDTIEVTVAGARAEERLADLVALVEDGVVEE